MFEQDEIELVDKMPMCSEKLVLDLLINFNRLAPNQIENKIRELKVRLEKEGLDSFENVNIYNELARNNGSLEGILKKLLSSLRDINMLQLKKLTDQNNQNLKKIEGKRVFLLLGLTGSGKSTTIHYLGGSQMVEVSRNGQTHIEPSYIVNEDLESIRTSCSYNSETIHLTPVNVSVNIRFYKDKFCIFCDSPGFNDNRSIELDISNSISIRKCFELCKEIKPIIITSKLSGDRFENLVELCDIIGNMFVEFEQDLPSFAYVFTKFKDADEVLGILENIDKDLNEKPANEVISSSFKSIISDMISKNQSLVVLNPLMRDENNNYYTQVINNLTSGNSYIREPSKRTRISFGQNTKSKIDSQIGKSLLSFEKSLKNFEFDLAKFKFENELILLRDILKERATNERIEHDIMKYVKDFDKQCNETKNSFEINIEQTKLINELEIINYLEYIKKLGNSYDLFKKISKILNSEEDFRINRLEIFKTSLVSKFREVLQNILKRENIFEQSQTLSITLDNVSLTREKCKLLFSKEEFDSEELNQVYNEAREQFLTKIDLFVKEIAIDLQDDFQHEKFDKLANQLAKIKFLSDHLRLHFEEIVSKCDQIKEKIFRKFQNLSTQFDSILNIREDFDEQELEENFKLVNENKEKLKDAKEFFNQALSNFIFMQYLNRNLIIEYQDAFNTKLNNYYAFIAESVETKIQSVKETMILDDHKYLDDRLNIMRNLKNITDQSKRYQEIIKSHEIVMNRIYELIENALQSYGSREKQQVDNLTHLLKDFKFLRTYNRSLYQNSINKLKSLVEDRLSEMETKLDELDLDDLFELNNLDNNKIIRFKELKKILKQIKNVQSLLFVINGLNQEIQPIRQDIPNKSIKKQKSISEKSLNEMLEQIKEQQNYQIQAFKDNSSFKNHNQLDVLFAYKIYFFLEYFPFEKTIHDSITQNEPNTQNLDKRCLTEFLENNFKNTINLDQIKSEFEFILNATDSTRPEAILKAQYLNKLLIQFENIIDKYSGLMKYFPVEVKDDYSAREFLLCYRHKIKSQIETIGYEMSLVELNEQNRLQIETKLKCLTEFHSFLRDDRCIELSKKTIREFQDQRKKLYQNLEVFINEQINGQKEVDDYSLNHLVNGLRSFNLANDYDKCALNNLKKNLNRIILKKCNKVRDECNQLKLTLESNALTCSDLKSISSCYNNVQTFKENLGDYLDPETINETDNFKREIKKALKDLIEDHLKEIENLYKKFDAKAEERLNEMLKPLFHEYLIVLEIYKEQISIINNLKANKKELILNSIRDHFKETSFSNEHLNTDDWSRARRTNLIYEKLNKFSFNDINECKDEFLNFIKEKFYAEIEAKKDEINEEIINNYRLNLVYVPEEIRKNVEKKLNNIQEELNTNKLISIIKETNDFNKIKDLYLKHKKNQKNNELIQNHLNEIVRVAAIRLEESLNTNNYESILSNFSTILEIHQTFANFNFADLVKKFKNSLDMVYSKYNVIYENFILLYNNLQQINYSEDLEVINVYNSMYGYMQQIIALEDSINISQNNLQNNFQNNISQYNKTPEKSQQLKDIETRFSQYVKHCESKIDTKQENEIKFSELSFYTTRLSFLNQLNITKNCNIRMYRYKENIKRSIRSKLDNLTNQINNLTSNNQTKMFQNDFNKYFKQFKNETDQMSEARKYFHELVSEDEIKEPLKKLETMINSYVNDLSSKLDFILENNTSEESIKEFNASYFSIIAYKENIDSTFQLDKIKYDMQSKIYAKLNKLKQKIIDKNQNLEIKRIKNEYDVSVRQADEAEIDLMKAKENLKSAEEEKCSEEKIKSVKKEIEDLEIKLVKATEEKEQKKKNLDLSDKYLSNASDCLIAIKNTANKFPMFIKEIDEQLNSCLNEFISLNGGFEIIGKLAIELKSNNYNSSIGSQIVSDHIQFESYQRSLFNRKTLSENIDKILEKISGDDLDTEKLRKNYELFNQKYNSLIQSYLKTKIDFNKFLSNLNNEIQSIISKNGKLYWNQSLVEKLPDLIAYLFSLWTLLNARGFFDVSQKDYLFLPHPAQVVAIFRMLGIGYKQRLMETIFDSGKRFFGFNSESPFKNNLVQIGTGEGKSVTLAITASVLALLGFDVYCVCYSDYLSQRDFNAFKKLFDSLNINEFVVYGTFNKICEMTINSKGDIREKVKDLILDKTNPNATKRSNLNRLRVLLIDEVDVFFSKDFYGNTYNPILHLNEPPIIDLIKYVWKNKKAKYGAIKNSTQYQNCASLLKGWEKLLEEATKDMLYVVEKFDQHEYIVKDEKIGYKYQDEITFNAFYGYYTVFAYLNEYENKKISNESLNKNLGILVRLGTLSYACIPLENFGSIIGVTGTLTSLSNLANKIISEEFHIQHKTYIPSVYGRNNLKFNYETDDLLVESEDKHYSVICQEIKKRIVGTNPSTKRAVFVVFETIKDLKNFYNSNEFLPLKLDAKILIEEANDAERKTIINLSTVSGKITLFTKVFGRGTDFIVHDQIVSANGGVSVIQTFLSEEYSEEIQIKGRTARQGGDGSYCLILSIKSLEKYSINQSDIDQQTNKTLYRFLDEKRNNFFRIQYEENIKFIKDIQKEHEKSKMFLNCLSSI